MENSAPVCFLPLWGCVLVPPPHLPPPRSAFSSHDFETISARAVIRPLMLSPRGFFGPFPTDLCFPDVRGPPRFYAHLLIHAPSPYQNRPLTRFRPFPTQLFRLFPRRQSVHGMPILLYDRPPVPDFPFPQLFFFHDERW